MHFSNDKSNYTSIKSCESPKVIIQQVNKWKDTQKQAPDNDVDSRPGVVLRSVGAEPDSGGWDPSSATSGPEPHSLTLTRKEMVTALHGSVKIHWDGKWNTLMYRASGTHSGMFPTVRTAKDGFTNDPRE